MIISRFWKETIKHVKKTLNKKVGDALKVKVLGRGTGEAVIKIITENVLEIELKILRISQPLEKKVSLAIGACRPLMMKRIFEHGATLGVSEF